MLGPGKWDRSSVAVRLSNTSGRTLRVYPPRSLVTVWLVQPPSDPLRQDVNPYPNISDEWVTLAPGQSVTSDVSLGLFIGGAGLRWKKVRCRLRYSDLIVKDEADRWGRKNGWKPGPKVSAVDSNAFYILATPFGVRGSVR